MAPPASASDVVTIAYQLFNAAIIAEFSQSAWQSSAVTLLRLCHQSSCHPYLRINTIHNLISLNFANKFTIC